MVVVWVSVVPPSLVFKAGTVCVPVSLTHGADAGPFPGSVGVGFSEQTGFFSIEPCVADHLTLSFPRGFV